jgi:hypothetical protein
LLSSCVIRKQQKSEHESQQKQQSEFNLAFHNVLLKSTDITVLSEEILVSVGAVNFRVAGCAVLVAYSRLVMEAWSAWRINLANLQCDIAVAFQTELIHIVTFQHLWVTSSVRCVTDCTAFNFGRRVLIDERSLLVRVALHARDVCACIKPRLLHFESAVGIVAITALHCPLQHSVVKRLCELAFHLVVTSQA